MISVKKLALALLVCNRGEGLRERQRVHDTAARLRRVAEQRDLHEMGGVAR